jgi:branched-chain amino acid transport system permease protein
MGLSFDRRRLALVGGLLLLAFVVVPVAASGAPYFIRVLTNCLILSFVSLGVWVTFAIGRINISQGAFAMIGGYTTAILSTRYGVPFWICLPLSGVAAAAVGALIGWPILRLKGVYFAMITLSLTEVVRLAALNFKDLTMGAIGIVNIPRPPAVALGGLVLVPSFEGADPLPFYFLAALLLSLGLLAVWRLSTSRLGWVFRSMRQNEDLASSIGINVAKYRVIAFSFCCFLAGLGGSFFAAYQQNIFPATYTVTDSINFMLYCFLGGLGFVFGPVVGAFLLVIAFEFLQFAQQYQALIYGVLMIACMLWLPNGILSLRLGRAEAGRSPPAVAPA